MTLEANLLNTDNGVPGTDQSTAPPVETQVAVAPNSTDLTPPVEADGESAAPAFQMPDDDSDLAGQETQPHVQAILNLRKELRTRNASLDALKPLEAFKEYGEPAVVKQYVDLARSFFTPVTKDGQPVLDEETGLQEITAAPAIQMLEEQAPGYVDNLLVDILNTKTPDGLARVAQVFKWYGLDPARYEDYKNIDRLLSSVNGAVSPEELENVPEAYRDAYRALPQSVRDDLQVASPLTRENYLRAHKAELERDALKAGEGKRAEEAQQRQINAAKEAVGQQQVQHIAQIRKEEFDSIYSSLSDWKPSADDTVNDLHRGLVMGAIASLLDEDLRQASEPLLKALGVKIDDTFDGVINRFVTEDSRAIAYEYYGSKMEANTARGNATVARQQLRAKLSSIASQIVKKMDGSRTPPSPTPARPTVPGGSPAPSNNGKPLPTGFNDDYALNIARGLGLVK